MSDSHKIKQAMSIKMRLILIFAGVVALVSGISVYSYHKSHVFVSDNATKISHVNNMESIPGIGNASDNYIKTQNQQNIHNANKAANDGTSAIPTITRPSFMGSDTLLSIAAKQSKDPAAANLAAVATHCAFPSIKAKHCTIADAKKARFAGVDAGELRCGGCKCPVLRMSGYTAGQMREAGWMAKPLNTCGYQLLQLKEAGFSATELANAGFTATALRGVGFTAAQLKVAGFNAKELKDAGFSAKELKDAGFTLIELKNAGFTAAQLKAAGFSACELNAVGFSFSLLRQVGFTKAQIMLCGSGKGVCSVATLKKERAQGISALNLKNKGCGAAAMRAAGYTAAELKQAGYSAKDLKAAGYSAADLRAAGFSAKDLKAAGFSAKQLKDAGFSAKQLKAAGFSAKDLKDAGFSAKQLKDAGFSAKELKAAGFTAGELKAAGFTAAQLRDAGFSAKQLRAAGFSAAGFSPTELKAAGYTDGDLLRAGFSAAQIGLNKSSVCTQKQLMHAHKLGTLASKLLKQGCSCSALRKANYSAIDLLNAHLSRQAAVVCGYSNNELKMAGYASPQPKGALIVSAPKLSSLPKVKAQQTAADKLAALQQRANDQFSAADKDIMAQQTAASMSAQAQSIMGSWHEAGSAQKITENNLPEVKAASQSADGSIAPGKTIKAGKIIFAVLTTGINSDEPSPILARIVDGPLKGSKLIGQFKRVNKKVVISFNMLSSPKYPKSIPINAVAIDQNTARTALSSSVNSHYLLRYGSLFASSFVSGFANAMATAGTGSVSIAHGAISIKSDTHPISTQDQVIAGVGNMGQQYASIMKGNFNRAPTVKVNSGVGMGILIMDDLTLPSTKLADNS